MENSQAKNINKKGWYASFHEHIYLHAYTAFATTIVIVAFFIFAMQVASATSKIANNPKILGVAYSTSPTPTASVSPSPSTTVSPTPTTSSSPSSTQTPSPSPASTATPTPSTTAIPTPTTSSSPSSTQTPSPSPKSTPSPTPSKTASPTPTQHVNFDAKVVSEPGPGTLALNVRIINNGDPITDLWIRASKETEGRVAFIPYVSHTSLGSKEILNFKVLPWAVGEDGLFVNLLISASDVTKELALNFTRIQPTASQEKFLRGDVDGDESISINDITTLSNYLYSASAISCEDAADTNDDGRIDISDLINLSSYISYGGDRLLPSPGSKTAGIDSTKDSLGCQKYPLEKKLVSPVISIKHKPLNVNVLSFIDTDKDGVNDFDEKNVFKTDPLNTDTDADGFSDGQEVSTGHDPKDPAPSASIAFYAYGKPRMDIKSEQACYNDFVKRFNVLKGKKSVKKSFLDFSKKASCYGGYNDSSIVASLKNSSLIHASIPASAWTKRNTGNSENIQNAQGGGAGTSQLLKVVSPQSKKFRRGDANIDGKVDISDIVRITEIFSSTKKLQCEDAADANDDGAIDLSDAIYLSLWYSLGTVQELPAPGAFTPGYDPTPDSLGCETYPYSGDIGTLSIESLESAGTTKKNTNNVLLGKFKFSVNNEPVAISMLDVHFLLKNLRPDLSDLITGVAIKDEAGRVVAGPKDSSLRLSDKTRIVIFTDKVVVPIGENIYSIYGNIGNSWNFGDSITTFIIPNELVIKGVDSEQIIIANPAGEVRAPEVKVVENDKLIISLSPQPQSQTVLPGQKNVEVARIVFDATKFSTNIRVKRFSFLIKGIDASPYIINNLRYVIDNKPHAPSGESYRCLSLQSCREKNTTLRVLTSFFYDSNPLIVPFRSKVVISIVGDISSDVVSGAFQIQMQDEEAIAENIDGAAVEVQYIPSEGGILSISKGSTLSIGLDSSVMPSRLVVAGSSMVPMTAVRLSAIKEDIDITQFVIRVVDGGLKGTGIGSFEQISKFYLKFDGNVVGNTSGYSIGASNMTITLGRGDLTIPMGTVGKKLEVLADLSRVGTNEAGTDNADIKLGLNGKNGFVAVGNGSNGIVANANKIYNDSTGSAVILHKAVPQIVMITPANTLSTSSALHEAKITAVGGNIGIFRLSYVTAISAGVGLTNAYTRLVSCGGGCGGINDGSQLSDTKTTGMGAIPGINVWNMAISANQSHGKSLLSIANGATAIIDFIATATLTSNVDTVSTSLLGDTASTMTDNLTGATAAAFTLNNQGDFVWSDFRNTEVTTSGGLTSPQWFNGYLVSGLGSTATSTPITIAEGGVPGAGSAGAGLDASALPKRLVVAGSSAVPLTDIRLKATNESIDITKLTVTVADAKINSAVGDYTQISKVYLKLDGTIVGSPSGYNMGSANLTINLVRGDLTIPEGNIGKKLSVLADIVPIGTNFPGTESADIILGLGGKGSDGFTATGNISAALIPVSLNDTTGSAVVLHKSVPQIIMVAPTNKLSATSALHEAKVTAVGGNIGIYRLSYVTTTSVNVNLTNGFTKLISCGGGCGGISDGSQLATTVATGSDVVSGVKIWNMAINPTQSHGKSFLSIANGATAIIDFIATATLTSNVDTVSTSLLGDTATTTPEESAFAYKILNQGNFVWSDLNITEASSESGLAAKQWFNGYLVAGLGVTSTSTAINIGD